LAFIFVDIRYNGRMKFRMNRRTVIVTTTRQVPLQSVCPQWSS